MLGALGGVTIVALVLLHRRPSFAVLIMWLLFAAIASLHAHGAWFL